MRIMDEESSRRDNFQIGSVQYIEKETKFYNAVRKK